MKLIQSYSLNSGFKINKLKPIESFYPVPEKYITLQTSSGMESKNYDYWLDVLEYLNKLLDIPVIHIGKDCPELPYCINLINKTNFHQTNYVLRNSLLHLGNDSFAIHLAGEHDVPIVGLYGPTTPDNHGPYFGKNQRLIESHRNGKNPSFSAQEASKTINYIFPEDVANAVLELLGKKNRVEETTHFIGPKYGQQIVEVIPDCIVDPRALQGNIPVMRCDYKYDEDIFIQSVASHKYSIVTDQETPLAIYQNFKQNIENVNFKASLESSIEYIRKLISLGLNVTLWTDDLENINDIRFKFLDISQVHLMEYTNHDVKIEGRYKSFRYLLSNGKIFLSKSDWENGRYINSPRENIIEVTKNIDLTRDLDYIRLIK